MYASSTATNWMPGSGFSAYFINQYGGDEIIDARVKARVALRVDSHQLSAQHGDPQKIVPVSTRAHQSIMIFAALSRRAVDFAGVQGAAAPFHRDYVRLYAGQSAHLFISFRRREEFAVSISFLSRKHGSPTLFVIAAKLSVPVSITLNARVPGESRPIRREARNPRVLFRRGGAAVCDRGSHRRARRRFFAAGGKLFLKGESKRKAAAFRSYRHLRQLSRHVCAADIEAPFFVPQS